MHGFKVEKQEGICKNDKLKMVQDDVKLKNYIYHGNQMVFLNKRNG